MENNTAGILNYSISSYSQSVEIEFVSLNNETNVYPTNQVIEMKLNIDPIANRNLDVLTDNFKDIDSLVEFPSG